MHIYFPLENKQDDLFTDKKKKLFMCRKRFFTTVKPTSHCDRTQMWNQDLFKKTDANDKCGNQAGIGKTIISCVKSRESWSIQVWLWGHFGLRNTTWSDAARPSPRSQTADSHKTQRNGFRHAAENRGCTQVPVLVRYGKPPLTALDFVKTAGFHCFNLFNFSATVKPLCLWS